MNSVFEECGGSLTSKHLVYRWEVGLVKCRTHTPMVDEGQAAVATGSPRRAPGAAEAGAEAPDASAEVRGPPEEIPRARPASPSPSVHSAAPREAGASGAAPASTPRRGGAGDEAARRALVARNRRASIAPPLWKVCARPRHASASLLGSREPLRCLGPRVCRARARARCSVPSLGEPSSVCSFASPPPLRRSYDRTRSRACGGCSRRSRTAVGCSATSLASARRCRSSPCWRR